MSCRASMHLTYWQWCQFTVLLVWAFQFHFMFLGQIKFVLGPGWQAKKNKKNECHLISKCFALLQLCERLTITLSQATVLVLLAVFQVLTACSKSRDYLNF